MTSMISILKNPGVRFLTSSSRVVKTTSAVNPAAGRFRIRGEIRERKTGRNASRSIE
jgi:hypothetical protein